MRSVVLGLLACWIYVVPPAHASTDNQGVFASGNSAVSAKVAPPRSSSKAPQQSAHKRTASGNKNLQLATPQVAKQASSPTLQSINSLADGSSPVNPWLPERGAIGVQVQVSW